VTAEDHVIKIPAYTQQSLKVEQLSGNILEILEQAEI
jgi:hypothetical protein